MVPDRMSQSAAKLDRSLARLQALSADATGSLSMLVEQGEKGELTVEKAMSIARVALGNTSVQICGEKKKDQ